MNEIDVNNPKQRAAADILLEFEGLRREMQILRCSRDLLAQTVDNQEITIQRLRKESDYRAELIRDALCPLGLNYWAPDEAVREAVSRVQHAEKLYSTSLGERATLIGEVSHLKAKLARALAWIENQVGLNEKPGLGHEFTPVSPSSLICDICYKVKREH